MKTFLLIFLTLAPEGTNLFTSNYDFMIPSQICFEILKNAETKKNNQGAEEQLLHVTFVQTNL